MVRVGKFLVLVGFSGFGKSIVIVFLERFYDFLLGCVFVDGEDICKFNLKSLWRCIVFVF